MIESVSKRMVPASLPIPRLIVEGAAEAPPGLLEGIRRDAAQALRWEDPGGQLIGHSGTRNGWCWIQLDGIATFLFRKNEEVVRAIVEGPANPELVSDSFRRSVLPHALQAGGMEVLHASAVRTGAGVLALCGRSGAGKSTLAFGLSQRGYSVWGDDAVAFEVSGNEAQTFSLPFRSRLRADAASYLEAVELPRNSDRSAGEAAGERCRLGAVVILERGGEIADAAPVEPVEIVRLPPEEAFTAILEHSYCFDPEDVERKRPMIGAYLDLAARVVVHRVRFADGLERVPALLDELERLV